MALSIESKVKELAENPKAAEICMANGLDLSDDRTKMAYGMTLSVLASFPSAGISESKLAAIDEALKAANL